MKKYHIYLDQLKFFSILEEDFLGHLKPSQFAVGSGAILAKL